MKKLIYLIFIILINLNSSISQWQAVPTNLGSIYLHSIDSESIIVGVNQTDIFRLTKNSNFWKPFNTNFISSTKFLSKLAHSGNSVLVSESQQDGRVYLSLNNGESFNAIPNLNSLSFINGVFINQQNKNMYINSFSGPRLLRSIDNGNTWNADTSGIQGLFTFQTSNIFSMDSIEIQLTNSTVYYRNNNQNSWKLWFNRVNGNQLVYYSLITHNKDILLASNKGIYKFMPTDSSWERFDKNNSEEIISGGLVSLGKFVAFSIISKGVYISGDNGFSWTHLPLDSSQNKSFRISKFDNKIIAFTSTGVFALDTNTFTWSKFGKNLMGLSTKDLVKVGSLLFATSSLYGVTETNLNGEYKNILPKHNAINIFSKENTVYVRTNLGIFKKHIHDSTWQNVHPILDNKNFLGLLLEGDTLYCLTANEIWAKPIKDTGCLKLGDGISDNAVNRLFIFNNSMYTFSAYGAYKFNKTTLKWDKAEYNLVNAAFNEACVYNAKLTVATSEGIFQLNEIGDEWVLIPNTEKYGEIKAMDTNGKILVFYSQSLPGVYYCADSNYNFYPFSHQLPTMDVKKMKIYEDTLYVGGTKGIWFRPLNELSSSIQSKVRNESVVAIYPNPFSESINLSMKNPSFVASSVTLKDMLGRTIKQELITNNPYKLSLQEIPSGLYLITIANDKFNVTYKVIKQ